MNAEEFQNATRFITALSGPSLGNIVDQTEDGDTPLGKIVIVPAKGVYTLQECAETSNMDGTPNYSNL